ncbi:MAG: S9 family peptidase [Rhodoglobus sp.]
MRATDIGALASVSKPSIHPSGEWAVVSVTRPSLLADATVGQLHRVQVDGSGSSRVTQGFRDSSPSVSPDGRWIAFLRATPDAASQLHVVDASGGEPVRLTDQKLGVREFRWNPDSAVIIYVARVAEAGRYGTVDGLGAAAEPARRMTDVRYKANGLGYTRDRPAQLFSVAVPAIGVEPRYAAAPSVAGEESALVPESVQLTTDNRDHGTPRFIGGEVAFLVDTTSLDLFSEILVLDPSGAPRLFSEPRLSIETFELGDDDSLYLIAQEVGDGTDFVGRNAGLFVVKNGAATRLTDAETIDLTGSPIVVDADRILVIDRTHGSNQLLEVTPDGTVTHLTAGPIDVEAVAADRDRLVVTYSDAHTFGDIAEVADGELTSLTDFSSELRETGLLEPHELIVTSRDGTPIHGWVVKPEGNGPHPTLLMIHGGPFAAYSAHAFDEPQVYADAGYAVVFCNPRGSAGYGQEHAQAIRQAMGTVDLTDVLDFLDGALDAHLELDRDRQGILGGSYGGYLTAWTIAHENRFSAAIVERGFLDPETFVGSSDIGWFFGQEYVGTEHAAVRAQSPQAVAHLVSTPTLVMHSEQDLRCPLGQAETYYATLALGGVETELLVFPGEDHELSRSGRPRHRVQRFEAIIEWFGRYLA